MSFPDISVTPPFLSNWQYSFAGLTFGQGQSWAVQSADGLGFPKLNSADSQRSRDQGEFKGLDIMGGRDLTLTMHTQAASSLALHTLLANLESVILPATDGVTETPLWFKRPGLPQLAMMVRVRNFGLKSENKVSYSHIAQPVIAFHATDPRCYGATQSGVAGAPVSSSGFGFPLTFDISFGGGSSATSISATNNGTWEMRPLLILTGPMLNPSIANSSLPGNPAVTFDIQLFDGDQLYIDMDAKSAVYFAAGTTIGQTRLNTIVASNWWNLPPGPNTISFNTGDTGMVLGTLEMEWADAYVSAF